MPKNIPHAYARTHACIGTLSHTYTHRKKGEKKSINTGMTMDGNFRLFQKTKETSRSYGAQSSR